MRTKTYHIFVSGRVQGVGYRRFAQKQAELRYLSGWTRNLWDGQVEIQVSGPESDLDEYCEVLKEGPAFSQVREVVIRNIEMEPAANQGFEIKADLEMR